MSRPTDRRCQDCGSAITDSWDAYCTPCHVTRRAVRVEHALRAEFASRSGPSRLAGSVRRTRPAS